jgi:MraZ protein
VHHKGSFDPMLVGRYEHTIDEKGRVSLPARFREELGESLVLAAGLDGQIEVLPPEVWRQKIERVRRLNMLDEEARELDQQLHGDAQECQVDKSGRILIPSWLRQERGIDTDVMIIGQTDHVQIWDARRWTERRAGGRSLELSKRLQARGNTL